MNVHIALFRWKEQVDAADVDSALADVEALAEKVPGILDIQTGRNSSKYGEGYTHVVLVRGVNAEAIDAYRSHPDHVTVAAKIEEMEEAGIGVDFAARDSPE